MSWSINEVARMSGITSRTLRHYQAIGLLEPESTGSRRGSSKWLYVEDARFRQNVGRGNDEMVEYLARAMATFAEAELA